MIRFGSRGSDLALTQSRAVAAELSRLTGEDFEIQVIQTRGDKNLSQPLPEIGGKGLFTTELEEALRRGEIDVAVHSLKDLPVEDPDGLTNGAIPVRERPHDVLVFKESARDPEGGTVPLLGESVVGTSSPRRASSLITLRPDLGIEDIRGNVETRARKVADGVYDATVLAAAGLSRLGLETPSLLRLELPLQLCTPAPGQGALGVQCRADDERILGLLQSIHHETTAACVNAERRVLFLLGGGCSMPLGVYVEPTEAGAYRMLVSLFSETNPACGVRLELRGDDPNTLAESAADQLRPLLGEPLAGRRVVLLRPGGSDGRLSGALRLAGAAVDTVPVSEILPCFTELELSSDLLRHIAFTSARAVDRFFEHIATLELTLDHSRFFAVGTATQQAIFNRGFDCACPSEPEGGRALAEFVRGQVNSSVPVLFPCAEERHEDFETTLRDHGFEVIALPVYKTVTMPNVEIPTADHLVFTSPSAVKAYTEGAASNPPEDRGPTRMLAIGQTTAGAMAKAGLIPQAVSESPTAQALVGLITGLPHDDSPKTPSPNTGDS